MANEAGDKETEDDDNPCGALLDEFSMVWPVPKISALKVSETLCACVSRSIAVWHVIA